MASCPSQLNAGLELHREGGAGGCYCSKTDGDRRRGVRVTTYNVTSPSRRCRKKQRHQGAAVSVLLPGPFQTPSLSSVGSESWAWDRSLPHPHHGPTEVTTKGEVLSLEREGAQALSLHHRANAPLGPRLHQTGLPRRTSPSCRVGTTGQNCFKSQLPLFPCVIWGRTAANLWRRAPALWLNRRLFAQ